ncbi:MAG: hypothetical protein F4029_18145 [Gammaproteobacteria bacterium]|nr:hypothetical protein [Gammaproteobacteria bacterium]MXY58400.1 hypothetical protein [Gammaproteobacteria bacterium]MYF27588.1 hypothetical protein [Gammaproteobacteria bacterium]MYK48139.1 hypothetical protein [Gammaproteobacteria bacterium]
MPPAVVLVGIGRGPWFVPVPVPVFLLWPLFVAAVVHRLFVRKSAAMRLARMAVAMRGLRIAVTGPGGERLLLRVL